jgi:glycerol-3-phosphate dehydrogenase (NAD(P)+)
MKKKILVIGSGAWGTALANHLAGNDYSVFLYTKNLATLQEINQQKTNFQKLPNIILHSNLLAINNYNQNADIVFIVVPSASCFEVFKQISTINFSSNTIFVLCSKGFGMQNQQIKLLSDIFLEITHYQNFAVLSGPNFALEVAKKQPTITTIASKNQNIANEIMFCLNNSYFFSQYSSNVLATELSGIFKNIMAIGCGFLDALDFGYNAKSALVCRGIVEIEMLCSFFKTESNLNTPAGFGDIFLTCSSLLSRNYRFGFALGTQQDINQNIIYEGAIACNLLADFAIKKQISLDLCKVIAKIINNNKKNDDLIFKQLNSAILQ